MSGTSFIMWTFMMSIGLFLGGLFLGLYIGATVMQMDAVVIEQPKEICNDPK